jgi:hypothetical protein
MILMLCIEGDPVTGPKFCWKISTENRRKMKKKVREMKRKEET